jgi:hypothetical protein
MQIEFDPSDLKRKYKNTEGTDQKINTSEVTGDKLNRKAQKVLKIVRRAGFFAWNRMTYNAVWYIPPKKKNKRSKGV